MDKRHVANDTFNPVMINLPKIDAYLKANEKYFRDGEYISFERELLMINEFTTMIVNYMKTCELLCTIHQIESFPKFVDGLNSLYHQFLRNILMNERNFELVMKRFMELKKLGYSEFGESVLF